MTDRLCLALAQIDAFPGDPAANAARIRAARAEAAGKGAALLVTPLRSLSGDAPWDAGAIGAALEDLAAETADGGPGLLVGAPWHEAGRVHDAAFLLDGGKVIARRARHEVRRGEPFDPGPAPGPVVFRGFRLGLMLGRDRLSPAVAETLAETGAELLLALDAEPNGASARIDHAVARVVETGLGLAFVNRVGGLGGTVCDGGAFVLNADRSLAMQLPWFEAAIHSGEWCREGPALACRTLDLAKPLHALQARWRAAMLGLAGEVQRRAAGGALVALSDKPAALLAAGLAVDALGAGRVRCVLLPSPDEALKDARETAARLGIACETIPLAPALDAFRGMLGEVPEGLPSRIRAMMLATLSERLGLLPVAADAPPAFPPWAFPPLAGLDAAEIAALARWRNARDGARPALPERTTPSDNTDHEP